MNGRLSAQQTSTLRNYVFECPVGRAVFASDFKLVNAQLTNVEFVSALYKLIVQREHLSPDETQEHVQAILRGTGIASQNQDLNQELETFPEVIEWRRQQILPFLTSLVNRLPVIGGDRTICDLRGAAPSGHVLRQCLVFFLFIVIAYHRVGLGVRSWPLRWRAFLVVQTIAIVLCGLSRVYAYEHTWSDELQSLALTLGLLSVAYLVRLAQRDSEQEMLRLLVEPTTAKILSSMRVLVTAYDQRGDILIWNSEAEYITGYSAQEIRTLEDYAKLLYPDASPKVIIDRKLRLMAENRSDTRSITEITTKTGIKKLVAWSGTSLLDSYGIPSARISVGHEINRFDRRLADVGVGALSLLHHIRGRLRRLDPPLTPSKLPEIEAALQDISHLCDDYREYVKTDAGPKTQIAVQDLLKVVIPSVVYEAYLANAVIRSNIPNDLPPILANEYVLRHAITDLVRNAIKAVEAASFNTDKLPSEILISARLSSEMNSTCLELDVSNEGLGLPALVKSWIESSGPTYDIPDGLETELGLGLLLAGVAVRDHGGSLFQKEENGFTIVGMLLPVLSERHHVSTLSHQHEWSEV